LLNVNSSRKQRGEQVASTFPELSSYWVSPPKAGSMNVWILFLVHDRS
jgi:hypothetical protein